MDMGPAHQRHSPLAFRSGGWATFPSRGTVPHSNLYILLKLLFLLKLIYITSVHVDNMWMPSIPFTLASYFMRFCHVLPIPSATDGCGGGRFHCYRQYGRGHSWHRVLLVYCFLHEIVFGFPFLNTIFSVKVFLLMTPDALAGLSNPRPRAACSSRYECSLTQNGQFI